MDNLYSDILLDLYKHPLNKQTLTEADLQYKLNNPVCGDQVELFIKFDENGTVNAVGWEGNGCTISQVGASLLTDHLKGKMKTELKQISADDVIKMIGLTLNATRLRCYLLSLTALQKALK